MTDPATLMDWSTERAPSARPSTAKREPHAPDDHDVPHAASVISHADSDDLRHVGYIEQPTTEDGPPLQLDERLLSSPAMSLSSEDPQLLEKLDLSATGAVLDALFVDEQPGHQGSLPLEAPAWPGTATGPESLSEGLRKPALASIPSFGTIADSQSAFEHSSSSVHPDGVASETTGRSGRRSHRSIIAEPETHPSGSTRYSEPHLTSGRSRESASGDDDPVTYSNARHFPPRLPTGPPLSGAHARSSATKKIHSWIARRRKDHTSRGSSTSRRTRTHAPSISEASRRSSDSFSSVVSDVDELWRQIEESRRKIRKDKAKMYKTRSEIKSLRPRILDADNAFMSSIRPMLVVRTFLSHASKDQVDSQFMVMQRLRNDYQVLEFQCEELEDRIDQEEAELYLLEVHFFSRLGWGDDDDASSTSSATNHGNRDIPHELRGILSEKPIEDLHPLYKDLTFAAAQLRSAQEELRGLHTMKQNCEHTMDIIRKTDQEVPSDVATFLSEYPTSEVSATNTIAHWRNKIQDLKGKCEKKKIMAKHKSVEMEVALNPGIKLEDITLGPVDPSQRDDLMIRRFPILLSQESHLLTGSLPLTSEQALQKANEIPDDDPYKHIQVRRAKKELDIDQLARGRDVIETRAQYMNRWLLLSLRTSSFHVLVLYTIFTGKLWVKNERRWQFDVLRYWYKDGMGMEEDLGDDGSFRVGQSGLGRSPSASEAATEGSLSWVESRAGTGSFDSLPDIPPLSLGGEE